MDSTSSVNQTIIAKEIARKKEEFLKNSQIVEIANQCITKKIEFKVEVLAGQSLRTVALKAAQDLGATWVILDRGMKKHKRYLLQELSSRISKIKRNNTIILLRGPKVIEITSKLPSEIFEGLGKTSLGEKTNGCDVDHGANENNNKISTLVPVTSSNERMISRETLFSSSHANTEPSCSSCTEPENSPYQQEVFTRKADLETAREQHIIYNGNIYCLGEGQMDEVFRKAACSLCTNRRPRVGCKMELKCAEVREATDGFSLRNYLWKDSSGSFYRGILRSGLRIMVKQHNNASLISKEKFKSEIDLLSKVQHENLVMPIGSCTEGNQRVLIYEYVCNGSLAQRLSRHNQIPLTWEARMKVSLGIAEALGYLHKFDIIHRDIRPNHILLTHDNEAMLLGDLGLSSTNQQDLDSDNSVVGKLGYVAPEFAASGKLSTMTDVYSFGVVLLQLITGLNPTDRILGGKSLVGWAKPLLKKKNYPELVDLKIAESLNLLQLFWIIRVAEKCLSTNPQKRLTMKKVVLALNYIKECNLTCSFGHRTWSSADSVFSALGSADSHTDEDTEQLALSSISILSIGSKTKSSQESGLSSASP